MKCDCDWCPKIPNDWGQVRIKDIATLKSGDTFTAEQLFDDAQYPVYGGNGLRGYTDIYNKDGDFVLIGRQGALCGNINYAHGKFFATEHALVVNTYNKENLTWLGETLRCANYNRLSTSAAQPGLAASVLMNQFIPYPPRHIREEIGNYLDTKITKIDRAISLLQKKRDAYTRLKTSVINRAVTRGLNPNVSLKDSGIDWIGKIPKGWEVKRLKDLGYMYSGLTGKSGEDFRSKELADNKPYIPFTNVLNHLEIDPHQLNYVVINDNEKQNKVKKNDLIFLMSS
ncbi:MAG: restriction endonuclease subunit S, partial [Prevotella sp.]